MSAKPSRLMIIEDDALIMESLREELREAGFDVVGVAYRLDTALSHIAAGEFDAVVMDANLAGVSASPAAAALRGKGTPFVVLSGYAREQITRDFPGAIFVQKPYQFNQILDALARALSGRRGELGEDPIAGARR